MSELIRRAELWPNGISEYPAHLGRVWIIDSGSKASDAGEVRAIFSSFGVTDHDGDVTVSGAISPGPVLLGAYNHASALGYSLPIGRGVIVNDGRCARIEASFFDTPEANATREVLKGLGPLAEWSFTYRVKEASHDYAELRQYPNARRILKKLQILEACPVIKGAGIGTQTEYVKSYRGIASLGDFVNLADLGEMRDGRVLRATI